MNLPCPNKDQSKVQRGKTGLLIGLFGVLINLLIFALELFSGLSTGSTTLTADAFHNLIDAVSAVLTVIAFLIIGKPADRKHPFGFGRVEYLGSLFIGIVILGIGFFFARSSLEQTLNPTPVQFSIIAFVLMLCSIPLKLLCGFLNRKYAQKITSQTLAASSLDALSDSLILAVAAFSLLFTRLTGMPIDGPLGLIVSSFIIFSGLSITKRAATSLIGEAPDPAVVENISVTVCEAKYVIGVHDLVVHDYGPEKTIASIHAEIPFHVPLPKAHQAVEQAERVLQQQGVELIVHIDPVGMDDDHRKHDPHSYIRHHHTPIPLKPKAGDCHASRAWNSM